MTQWANQHTVRIWGEPNPYGGIARSDAHIECTCGWKDKVSLAHTSDPMVRVKVIEHRFEVLERALGIWFTRIYGKEDSS